MSFPINRTSLAAALAALAGRWPANVIHDGEGMTAPTRIRKFQPFARYFEQGARECARRQGGQAWAEFKSGDRMRRGLPLTDTALKALDLARDAYDEAHGWPRMRGGA